MLPILTIFNDYKHFGQFCTIFSHFEQLLQPFWTIFDDFESSWTYFNNLTPYLTFFFFKTIFDCYEQVLKHLYPTPQKMPRMVHNPLSNLPTKKQKKNFEKEVPIPHPKDDFDS